MSATDSTGGETPHSPPVVTTGYRWKHRLSNIDAARVADCAECGPSIPLRIGATRDDHIVWRCGISGRQRDERRNHRSPQRATSNRKYSLKAKFGLTVDEYDALLTAQGGVCAICEQPCATRRHLAVDHDHETGRVRGLLCNQCNRALGLLRDDPARLRRAIAYLN